LLGASIVGCGGNSNGDGGTMYHDATVFDGPKDKGTGDATGDTGPAGPPPIGTGSKLIVAGNIELIGSGPDSCTNQVPPTGDRWCGFGRLSSDLVDEELWVVNVTKAAQGVTITCDPTVKDPNCIRLSTGLYSDAANGFRVHAFDGDTLTYEEVPSMAGGGFLGSVFAWRPGWTAPHKIGGSKAFFCNGHAKSAAAACFSNPVADSTNMFYHSVELHAGVLSDTDGELPLVDSIIVHGAMDGQGVTKFGIQLSPDGQAVAWSTRATDNGTEDLKWQRLNDDSSRVTVATDVNSWVISTDAKKWFWLKTFNYDTNGAPSGTLQSAPYPGGMPPLAIASAVGDFMEAGGGLVFRSNVKGDVGSLVLVPDRDVPATVAMVDTGVAFVFGTTKDGKTATYSKNIVATPSGAPEFDIYAGNGMGTMPCPLTSKTNAFMPPTILGGGSVLVWGRVNNLTQDLEGLGTTVPGCVTTKFASNFIDMTAVGTEGAVYLDDVNPDPAIFEASLRSVKLANGNLPGPGTVVQSRSGLQYSVLLPALDAVVYAITSNTTADGLYVNPTLPFTVTTSVPDGGTTMPEAGPSEAGPSEAGPSDVGLPDGGVPDGSMVEASGLE
jgi:hypothetical protein